MTDCGVLKPGDPAYHLNHDLKKHGYGSLYATMSGSLTSGYRSIVVFCSEDSLSQVDARIGFDRLKIIHAILAANVPQRVNLGGTGFVQVRRNCFTHKEHDILSLLASGLRNDQIAHKMNIAEVTVRKHLLSVRKKLGAKTGMNGWDYKFVMRQFFNLHCTKKIPLARTLQDNDYCFQLGARSPARAVFWSGLRPF
jgi:hypothetical protein